MDKRARRGGSVLTWALGSALVLVPLTAQAQDDGGKERRWYGSLLTGYETVPDVDLATGAGNKYTFELDGGWGFGFRVGYLVAPAIRLEGEYTYWSADLADGKANGTDGTGTGTVDQGTFLANAYYDLSLMDRLDANIGAGLGMTVVGLSDVSITATGETPFSGEIDSETALAYQIGVGASYGLSDRLFLDLSYRYQGSGEIEFESDNGNTGAIDSVDSHNYLLGIRYHF